MVLYLKFMVAPFLNHETVSQHYNKTQYAI